MRKFICYIIELADIWRGSTFWRLCTVGTGELEFAFDDNLARVRVAGRSRALAPGEEATLGIRPEYLLLDPNGPLGATVEVVEVLGAETIVHLRLASGTLLLVALRGIAALPNGSIVRLGFSERFVHVFDNAGVVLEPLRSWKGDYLIEPTVTHMSIGVDSGR